MNEQTILAEDPVGLDTLEVIAKANRFNKWLFSQFKHLLKGKILEIGSGIGNLSQVVIDSGLRLTVSDYNPGYFQYLKERYKNNPQVENVLQIDLIHPQFKEAYADLKGTFDSIFLLNVIEHIEDDITAIENCKYLLMPEGHLILLAPAGQWLYCKLDKELGHYRRYSMKQLSELMIRNELTIIKKEYFNFLGILGWLVSGKILQHKMLRKTEMSVFDNLVMPAKIIDRLLSKKAGLSVIVAGKKA